MPFRLKRHEPVDASARRIAIEQIDRALDDSHGSDPDQGVHEVRKRCKKLRGLLRLVRDGLAEFKDEDHVIRDIARHLAPSRDAAVRLELFHALINEGVVDESSTESLGRRLEDDAGSAAADAPDAPQRLADIGYALTRLRDRAASWTLPQNGFGAIRDGLARTYTSARDAMDAAAAHPTTETLHTWRKHAKYHWHHMSLLRSIWPDEMAARRHAANALSEHLGDEHDLAELDAYLAAVDVDPTTTLVRESIAGRRNALQQQALEIGLTLFAEKPKPFLQRIETYFNAWRNA